MVDKVVEYEFEIPWSGKLVEYVVDIESLMKAGHTREEAIKILDEMRKMVEEDIKNGVYDV